MANLPPAVIACGYKQIKSHKSNLTFPAFLISLPIDDDDDNNKNSNGTTENNNKVRFVWRTKRDFLLLGRAAASCNSNSNSHYSLPKAALKKLAETTPWKKPGLVLPSLSHLLGNMEEDDNNNNHYHVRMKKSILHLDKFLQFVSTNDNMKDEWQYFCRPGDTEGLIVTNNSLSITDDDDTTTSSSTKITTTTTTTTTTTPNRSSQLGQYFCSKENAKLICKFVIDKVKHLLWTYPDNDDNDDDDDHSRRPLLFVEPSCGHGDIIKELIKQLDNFYYNNNNKNENNEPTTTRRRKREIFIHGYDIDPNAIRKCRQSVSVSSSSSCEFSIKWTCENFLESSLSSNNVGGGSSSSSIANNINKKPPLVICLGGPPYTTGQGRGKDIQRDLPTQFISHCIKEYKALMICFLLPARYRRDNNNINNNNDDDAAAGGNSSVVVVPEEYQKVTIDLPSSTFFFQGTTPVIQPSIIQSFSCL